MVLKAPNINSVDPYQIVAYSGLNYYFFHFANQQVLEEHLDS